MPERAQFLTALSLRIRGVKLRGADHLLPLATTILQWVAAGLAVWFIDAFIFVAFSSMTYPFHLEWMEGQNIDVVKRIAEGLPVYAPPTIEYVPFIYTPYYYYVVAFVSLFTGVEFFPARLVSTLAALGTGAVIYAWVRKEGGNWKAALAGAGLFYATYRLSGRWFDAGRVDSLFLFLMLSGLYVFYFYRGWANAFLAAALLAMGFFTKQMTLMIAAPVICAGVLLDWRHALRVGSLFALFLGAGILIANLASNGWFSFYVFNVPAGHGFDARYFKGFWMGDIRLHTLPLTLVGLLAVGSCWYKNHNKGLWYAALFVSFIMGAYFSRIHWGGWSNVLMPMHAMLALMAGLAIAGNHFGVRLSPLIALALVFWQMSKVMYNPLPLVPDKSSVAEGEKFLEEIKKIDGDIFMPELQFVQTRVGKKSYDFGMAGFDVLRSDLGTLSGVRYKLRLDLREALARQEFAAVMPGRLIKIYESYPYYAPRKVLHYPREYVTGAINFLRTTLYFPIPGAGMKQEVEK